MRWKQHIITIMSTLAVTVIAGLIVFYLTKEPTEVKHEKLVYFVQDGASFKGDEKELAFGSVQIENLGNAPAEDVIATILFEKSQIRDLAIESGETSQEVMREIKAQNILLGYKNILPGESLQISYLLSNTEKPNVEVRSKQGFGLSKEEIVLGKEHSVLHSITKYIVLVLTSGFFFFPLLIFLFLKKRGYQFISSKNNVGFLLMHSGLLDEAEQVLSESLYGGRHDIFTFSNLAACKALQGKDAESESLMKAAEYFSSRGHPKAVLNFNQAIILFNKGLDQEAVDKLKEALNHSRSAIKLYIEKSVHFEKIVDEPEVKNLLGLS